MATNADQRKWRQIPCPRCPLGWPFSKEKWLVPSLVWFDLGLDGKMTRWTTSTLTGRLWSPSWPRDVSRSTYQRSGRAENLVKTITKHERVTVHYVTGTFAKPTPHPVQDEDTRRSSSDKKRGWRLLCCQENSPWNGLPRLEPIVWKSFPKLLSGTDNGLRESIFDP